MLRNEVLQQGIYYSHANYPRSSYTVIFLSARRPYNTIKIRKTILRLWKLYGNLQKGILSDVGTTNRQAHHGNLSVQLGYGPRLFEIDGLKKRRPRYLRDELLFQEAKLGGDPILPGVGLRYAEDLRSNTIADDHFVFQFIGDTQLATSRPIVETWKLLRKIEMDGSSAPLVMRHFFTGFNRPDGRSWLGFHDGVSNIRSSERLWNIQIDRRALDYEDHWTALGTYMAFLRITIDIEIWESLSISNQERIVGREKTTGCPLVRVDERDRNIFATGCPVPGTSEILEKGNERFRGYGPTYGRGNAPRIRDAEKSHVGRMLRVPDRIFRQGYEFIEAINDYPYFRVGLNFVSFQSGTDKLYRIIKHGFDRVNFGGDPLKLIPGADRLLSVRAAGVYLVPPFYPSRREEFPGDTIW
jgi:Dyp-type peroxidase family